ncbi:hypothetical protein BCON_0201g00240 [Botryotinia convoluta]|uniref:Uncharacterized protein n=1 Tax=Botryotinia convoluta TaxID=54673 RepID=A0A4Z1HKZ3_9HELO|nr:hypothetical protein BCON_0201g00240 [Botryotinia convoluta]
MVIHHTDSETTHFTNGDIRDSLRAKHHHEINDMTFGAIDNLKQSVIDDIAILRENHYTRKKFAENTFGFKYDLKNSKLETVTVS